ncbi:MAG: tryptophanase [Bdellovibrionales bacterium]|nr:tryptophanase [Bdellovibrionales bacterium]
MENLIEPYKIKSLEPIYWTSREERKEILKKAHLNLFFISSKNVIIDLLTDSGTGAMSANQWASLMNADESYAGSKSFDLFEQTVQEITGFKHVIPTHQGRSAERILLSQFKQNGEYIVSNTLFDTTRANSEDYGFKVLDIPCPEFFKDDEVHPFKGNIDLIALEKTLKEKSVALVILTITNNSAGAQPVSLENIKETKKLCQKYFVPLCLDACRFSENAWFIKKRESGFSKKTIKEIVKTSFDCADLTFVSAKKDGLSHIGGFLCVRESTLSENCKNRLILTEGFPTYGGLAGRDLEAVALGLREVLEESYLKHRIDSTAYLHQQLLEGGFPVLSPPGGHAVYIDAKKLLAHLPVSSYPGQALVSSLYEYAGIRTCEIGSVMFGKTLENGKEIYHNKELVRLCLPRRVYTKSHLNYVSNSLISFKEKELDKIRGIKIVKSSPFLRHFSSHFDWI